MVDLDTALATVGVRDMETSVCNPSEMNWLPAGKSCAVCFSIDDIHPAKSSDAYEAGGDLGAGALGHLEWLSKRHPELKTTLFVTADWREISPVPTRTLLATIPVLRDYVYLAPRWPRGKMSLERHGSFVTYLNGLENVEVALHGLHHVSKGMHIPLEFQDASLFECERKLRLMCEIAGRAGLTHVLGLCPPGWNAPTPLLQAMAAQGFSFIASARDILTPVSRGARSNMSGMKGVPLFAPWPTGHRSLVHIPANFQATNSPDRAASILEMGGLLSIKAHIVKSALGHIAKDGFDAAYASYLDELLDSLRRQFGTSIWWASMSEIAARVQFARQTPSSQADG